MFAVHQPKTSMNADQQKPEEIQAWTQWFEIPVEDMQRAKTFYDSIFGIDIAVMDFGGFHMGIFPHHQIGAALCKGDAYKPSQDGLLVYFNANPDLATVLARIEAAGGKIIRDKTIISPEHGHMALFIDSEGNRLALHSME